MRKGVGWRGVIEGVLCLCMTSSVIIGLVFFGQCYIII